MIDMRDVSQRSKRPRKAVGPKPAKRKGGDGNLPRVCYKPVKQRCDIGYVVKDYVKPVMQAMTHDIKSYNMRLITTKCLNTAVMFMVLFFGESALEDTEYCDVANVVKRHKSAEDNNVALAKQLHEDMMKPSSKRMVYYIMLTDGHFVRPDGHTAFFPGHVMVWEKVPTAKRNHYYIYQSYINKYDYKGSLAFREWSAVSESKMGKFMLRLEKFMTERVWTKRMVNFWEDLTNVNTIDMLGGKPVDCFYLCYRVRENYQCLTNLYRLVEDTLHAIPTDDESANKIYGESSDYEKRERPLTNRQMFDSFHSLRDNLGQAIQDDQMPCRLIGTCPKPRTMVQTRQNASIKTM